MYRFGDYEVDVPARELRCRSEPVHIEPQAFDLLVHLLEHRDRVVSKIELLDGVWGHRFVSEANLTTRVKEARRAVGDDGARQEVIRNVRGRGYRFVAPVEVGAPPPPSIRSGLIGRDGELRAIVDLLERAPLVTILGPGGVGKSTLARKAAADIGGSSGLPAARWAQQHDDSNTWQGDVAHRVTNTVRLSALCKLRRIHGTPANTVGGGVHDRTHRLAASGRARDAHPSGLPRRRA